MRYTADEIQRMNVLTNANQAEVIQMITDQLASLTERQDKIIEALRLVGLEMKLDAAFGRGGKSG